ncbi:MAG TPA: GtrA family protein, partial [Amnibacterium sp.]|nr:GtrA family protein [Amnibacterium sp.]
LGRGPIGPTTSPRFVSQVLRFGVVGALSTLAFALLFLALRPLFGEQAANFLALLVTAIANTGVNRWFTFGVTGRVGAVRHQAQGLVVFALAWCITSGSLVALHDVVPHPSPAEEILVLTVANLTATVLRFVLLRAWVFRTRAPRARRPGRRTPLDATPAPDTMEIAP